MNKKLLSLLVGIVFLLNIVGVCSLFLSVWNYFNLDEDYLGLMLILVFLGDTMFIGNLQKIEDYLDDKITVKEVLDKLNKLNYLDYSNLKKIEHFTIEKRESTLALKNDMKVEYYELVTHIRNKHRIDIVSGKNSIEEHGLLFERINDLSQIPDTQEKLEQLDKKLQEADNKESKAMSD